MSTLKEMINVLKSSDLESKRNLFEELFNKGLSEEGLSDDEIPILETLKKELMKPKSQIVSMSATVQGIAGVKG